MERRWDNVPSSPDGMHTGSLGNVDNQVDVGVVVVVSSSGDLDESISHSDVIGINFPVMQGWGKEGDQGVDCYAREQRSIR